MVCIENYSFLIPLYLENFVLLFFKLFDIKTQTLSYVGCGMVQVSTLVSRLSSHILQLANLPLDAPADLYEEEVGSCCSMCLKPIESSQDVKADRITFLSPDATIQTSRLIHGDIVVCQERSCITPGDFFHDNGCGFKCSQVLTSWMKGFLGETNRACFTITFHLFFRCFITEQS